MNVVNRDALPKGTKLQGGKFIVDCLFSDQGGFSLIYEGRAIRKVEDEFFGSSRVNIIEEDVIIKELYFRDKSERREGQTALTWHPKDKNDKELIQTFKEKTKSEAEKLARLVEKTPYIIVIYAAFEENDTVYLITKKIEGAKDFRSIIKGDKKKAIAPEKLELKTSLRYIHNVCQALKVVHNNNIIHLDIKPSNILRDEKDNAVLIDFGISVSVETGQIKTLLDGAISRHYSPPEQGSKDKKNIGFYSDIYALGATMYFFFTGGHLPPEYGELISSGETFLPPSYYNDEVSDYLDSVVIKCLSLSFRHRYQTMEELIEALKGEKKYNTLVAEAHKALSDKKYEKGIEAIVATESLIPLSIELQSLKHELQRGREKEQKEEENKKQIVNAETLIAQQKYKEAIDLLQLLPENASIKQKIAYCEKQLVEQQLTKLLADAANYESNNNHQKALETYLEAKKLKQNNNEINSKIDSLGLLLVEMREKEAISCILRENEAISIVLSGYENQLLSFENLNVSVEDYLQKYPQDNDTREKWNAIKANQQKIRDTNEQQAKEKESDKTIISEIKTPKSETPHSTDTIYASTKENEANKSVNSNTKYKDNYTGNFSQVNSLKKKKKIAFWTIGILLLLFAIGIIGENESSETSIDKNSFEYVKTEAEKGNVEAMNTLAGLYSDGEVVSQDYSMAKHWYEKAAEKGDDGAMYILGVMYFNGIGVSQDYSLAKIWYEKSAEFGHSYSMNNLGEMYYYGSGVSQDYSKAIDLFEKAIAKSNMDAMSNLGYIYLSGEGAKQDYTKAKYLFEKAAEKGDAYAMNSLGVIHHNGEGVSQDYAEARKWYEKAVEKGNPAAMNNLGILYEYGQGVTQDYDQAKSWYKKAAKLEDETAQDALKRLGETW